MQVKRIISVFNKKDKTLYREIDIDFLDVKNLKKIFMPTNEDPSMYLVYKISIEEATELKNCLDIDFDFKKYLYQLDCFKKI